MDTENMIEVYYQASNIRFPHQIDLDVIAQRLSIKVRRVQEDSGAFTHRGRRLVALDSRETNESQREQLAHEIAHHILHQGNQMEMYETFRHFQEEQTQRTSLFILAPTFMLDALWPECPQYLEQQTVWLAQTFRVTYECMARRLELYETTSQRLGSQAHNHIHQ